MTDRSFCVGCGRLDICSLEPLSRHCVLQAKMKAEPPQTNADRIRAMSDEELAEFIGGIFTVERDVWGDYDPRLVVTQEPRVEVRNKEDMMDWLKSSADGGDWDGSQ